MWPDGADAGASGAGPRGRVTLAEGDAIGVPQAGHFTSEVLSGVNMVRQDEQIMGDATIKAPPEGTGL
jgi:hypothetical protein